MKASRVLLLLGSESDPDRLSIGGRIALFLTGPWMILPWLYLLTILVAGSFPLPTESYGRPEAFLFFQGDTDWGGGIMFAIETSMLLFFAFTAAWHLSLRLRAFRDRVGFGRRLGRALAVMSPFLVVFLAAAAFLFLDDVIMAISDEGPYGPTSVADIDAVTFTAAIVYALSIPFVTWLDGTRLSAPAKTLLAPAVAVLWCILGADGQTPRAGQMLQSGWEPLPAVRGIRHGIMVSWHRLCIRAASRHRPKVPADSPLWFWTDGRLEFGPNADDSPSAQAMRRREDLPWVTEGRAFTVPILAHDDTPTCALFPYSTAGRAYGGYFLQMPDGPVRILHGMIEPQRWYGYRDVYLRDGDPYWELILQSDGSCLGERRTVDLEAWGDSSRDRPTVPPTEPFTPSPQDERIPVELRVEGGVPFASLTNCLLTLRRCGFGDVFVR